jgi:hypothetical protein
VSNNGWVSEIFKHSTGIRQLYPLSALLFILSVSALSFILSVEFMALRLRSNKNITGITIKIDENNHII